MAKLLPVSIRQPPPPDQERLNTIDITANLAALAAANSAILHLKAFDLPPQREKLVLDTAGIVDLGERLARSHLEHP